MSAVFCIVKDRSLAVSIVDQLRSAGFTSNSISVLLPDQSGTRDFAHEQHTKAPEGAATGAGAGGLMGGSLGWLVGIGALAIPGLGPFIAAGPIMAALAGAAVGAAVGGVGGALIGMGLPELEAKQYEGKLKSGNVLISVHTDTRDQTNTAKRILEDAGAEDIKVGGEATPPKVETRVGDRQRTV